MPRLEGPKPPTQSTNLLGFIPIPGEMIQFDYYYFSNGLKPPISLPLAEIWIGSGPKKYKKYPAIFDPPGPVPHRIARSSRLQVSWRHREKKPVVFEMRRMPVWGAPEKFRFRFRFQNHFFRIFPKKNSIRRTPGKFMAKTVENGNHHSIPDHPILRSDDS